MPHSKNALCESLSTLPKTKDSAPQAGKRVPGCIHTKSLFQGDLRDVSIVRIQQQIKTNRRAVTDVSQALSARSARYAMDAELDCTGTSTTLPLTKRAAWCDGGKPPQPKRQQATALHIGDYAVFGSATACRRFRSRAACRPCRGDALGSGGRGAVRAGIDPMDPETVTDGSQGLSARSARYPWIP